MHLMHRGFAVSSVTVATRITHQERSSGDYDLLDGMLPAPPRSCLRASISRRDFHSESRRAAGLIDRDGGDRNTPFKFLPIATVSGVITQCHRLGPLPFTRREVATDSLGSR